MTSLLIIGGSGFFGKSILDAYRRGLLKKWSIDYIYVFARGASKLRISNPELLTSTVCLLDGDITTVQTLPEADYVIHAAASADAATYHVDAAQQFENITAGVANFCKIASHFNRPTRILYISTGAVYGNPVAPMMPYEEHSSFSVSTDIPPMKRTYALAKRQSEKEIINLAKCGASTAIARCFSFVGLYLPRDRHFAIGNFVQNGLQGKNIDVKATHLVYRSYMYADDLVCWMMAILNIADTKCPIFNVGSDEEIELRTLAETAARTFGTTVHSNRIISKHIDYYVPSVSLAKKLLNIDIKYNVEASLRVIKKSLLG